MQLNIPRYGLFRINSVGRVYLADRGEILSSLTLDAGQPSDDHEFIVDFKHGDVLQGVAPVEYPKPEWVNYSLDNASRGDRDE